MFACQQICALKVNGSWERVMLRRHCTASCCSLRTEGKEQPSTPEHWHVALMEVGSIKCVPLSQLALVTRNIASETRKARFYFLRRIYLDDEKKDQVRHKAMDTLWLPFKEDLRVVAIYTL